MVRFGVNVWDMVLPVSLLMFLHFCVNLFSDSTFLVCAFTFPIGRVPSQVDLRSDLPYLTLPQSVSL